MASITVEQGEERDGEETGFHAEPPVRQRVADHVFEHLARAIFRGELKAGKPLPTQRELARQFKISALVVRQAIHRLEDLGLVRVRQGSTTIVLDPAESSDIRLIQLQMELADPKENLASAAFENQVLFLIPLLALAERRITKEELAVLNYLIDQAEAKKPDGNAARDFRIEFFRQIAKATRNTLFQQQVRWWSSLLADLERRGRDYKVPPVPANYEFYRQLTASLARGQGTVKFYLDMVEPLLAWMDRQQGIEARERG
ncbi:MAG: GntR family transcriptional regulator [Myxococcales bacterium]|nr:GntR family transcriptional regulator [Myxococcales bacterium]